MRFGVSSNRRSVSALALLVGLVIAPGAAGHRAAHHPPLVFQGVMATTTPTIDGALGAAEWTDAPVVPRDLRLPLRDGEVQARRAVPRTSRSP